MPLSQPDRTERSLVACLAPVHDIGTQQLVRALILSYNALDADLLVLPLSAMLSDLYKLVRSYESDGQMRVVPAVEVPSEMVSFGSIVLNELLLAVWRRREP